MFISIINTETGELNYTTEISDTSNEELLKIARTESENDLCAIIGDGESHTQPVTNPVVIAVNGIVLWSDFGEE